MFRVFCRNGFFEYIQREGESGRNPSEGYSNPVAAVKPAIPSKQTNGSDYGNINFKKFEYESYEAAYPKFTKHSPIKSDDDKDEEYEEEPQSPSDDVSNEQYREDTENSNHGSNGKFEYESYERNF